jgi:SulP family sulfate permease
MEIAGSLGDLGTLLPLAIGMIIINGLSPMGLFFSIGIYFILSGIYYGITVPVQPMKVIGAYAIATAMTASQVMASAVLMGVILLIIGGTNAITLIGRYIPKPVVRGVQLSTGTLLMAQGVKFMIGTSKFQAVRNLAEPYLVVQHIGPVSIGIVIGIIGAFLTLLLQFQDADGLPFDRQGKDGQRLELVFFQIGQLGGVGLQVAGMDHQRFQGFHVR